VLRALKKDGLLESIESVRSDGACFSQYALRLADSLLICLNRILIVHAWAWRVAQTALFEQNTGITLRIEAGD
jgi:hypothetical protein